MSSELSREEIADMRVQIKAAQSNLWAQVHREALHAKADALCDMALAHLDSKEAGRVSVPRDALEAMRDCARELSKKADQHMLGICSPAALALPSVALAGEINDLLSAAPAPADQDEYYWWCAGCQREVPQEEVGLDNKHTLCPNKLNRWRRAAPSPGAQSGSPDAGGRQE